MSIRELFISIKNNDDVNELMNRLYESGELDVMGSYDDHVLIHEPSNLLDFALFNMRYDVVEMVVKMVKDKKKYKKNIVNKLLRHITYITNDLKSSIINCKYYDTDIQDLNINLDFKSNLQFINDYSSAILFINNIIIKNF